MATTTYVPTRKATAVYTLFLFNDLFEMFRKEFHNYFLSSEGNAVIKILNICVVHVKLVIITPAALVGRTFWASTYNQVLTAAIHCFAVIKFLDLIDYTGETL